MAAIIRLEHASSADRAERSRGTLMKIRSSASVSTLAVAIFLAHATRAAGQEITPGNALNPRAISSIVERDPEGLGIAESSRTPTGLLIVPTPLVKEPRKTAGGWLYQALVEFAPIGVGGDEGIAKYREYKDLGSGAYLNNFTVMLEKPASAFHFDALGGGVPRNDQYYGLDVGRYNTWRVRGSFSQIPHFFTSNYRSLWGGTGDGPLAPLALQGLRPGGTTDANTTQANMLLAISSLPASDVELGRKRSRARFDLTLPAHWKAFASYAYEHRQDFRPFGAVFGGGGGGGNVEIPEPIDYNTQDLLAGLQFASALTSVNLQTSASFFHNDIDTLMFQNPLFITTNTIAGVPATLYSRAARSLSEQRLLQLQGGVCQEVPEASQEPGDGRRVGRPFAAERRRDSVGDRAADGGHHQRGLDHQHVELDRLAEQAVGRRAYRHHPCRSRHPPESCTIAGHQGQGPLLRFRQQHAVPRL
jgi:hypothetical protein